MELKSTHPECVCTGLDGDPKILDIARQKAETNGLDLHFDRALSVQMPYENDSRDRVFSSLFFHHLTKESKAKTLSEIFRVLRPGGELHVADWGKAQNFLMRIAFYQVQLLDGFATTSDNVEGLLPRYFSEAGFEEIEETTRYSTVYGTLSLYRAKSLETKS